MSAYTLCVFVYVHLCEWKEVARSTDAYDGVRNILTFTFSLLFLSLVAQRLIIDVWQAAV